MTGHRGDGANKVIRTDDAGRQIVQMTGRRGNTPDQHHIRVESGKIFIISPFVGYDSIIEHPFLVDQRVRLVDDIREYTITQIQTVMNLTNSEIELTTNPPVLGTNATSLVIVEDNVVLLDDAGRQVTTSSSYNGSRNGFLFPHEMTLQRSFKIVQTTTSRLMLGYLFAVTPIANYLGLGPVLLLTVTSDSQPLRDLDLSTNDTIIFESIPDNLHFSGVYNLTGQELSILSITDRMITIPNPFSAGMTNYTTFEIATVESVRSTIAVADVAEQRSYVLRQYTVMRYRKSSEATDFTNYGAPNNDIGTTFNATTVPDAFENYGSGVVIPSYSRVAPGDIIYETIQGNGIDIGTTYRNTDLCYLYGSSDNNDDYMNMQTLKFEWSEYPRLVPAEDDQSQWRVMIHFEPGDSFDIRKSDGTLQTFTARASDYALGKFDFKAVTNDSPRTVSLRESAQSVVRALNNVDEFYADYEEYLFPTPQTYPNILRYDITFPNNIPDAIYLPSGGWINIYVYRPNVGDVGENPVPVSSWIPYYPTSNELYEGYEHGSQIITTQGTQIAVLLNPNISEQEQGRRLLPREWTSEVQQKKLSKFFIETSYVEPRERGLSVAEFEIDSLVNSHAAPWIRVSNKLPPNVYAASYEKNGDIQGASLEEIKQEITTPVTRDRHVYTGLCNVDTRSYPFRYWRMGYHNVPSLICKLADPINMYEELVPILDVAGLPLHGAITLRGVNGEEIIEYDGIRFDFDCTVVDGQTLSPCTNNGGQSGGRIVIFGQIQSGMLVSNEGGEFGDGIRVESVDYAAGTVTLAETPTTGFSDDMIQCRFTAKSSDNQNYRLRGRGDLLITGRGSPEIHFNAGDEVIPHYDVIFDHVIRQGS